MFKFVSKFEDLHHEFTSYKNAIHNRFDVNKLSSQQDMWNSLSMAIEETNKIPGFYIENFWDWAKSQRWQNVAIPETFVKSSKPFDGREKDYQWHQGARDPKCSPLTFLLKLIGKSIGIDVLPNIETRVCQFYGNVFLSEREGAIEEFRSLSIDCHEMAKLELFTNSHAGVVDYISRTGSIPTSFIQDNTIGISAIEVVKRIYKSELDYKCASTWTDSFIPYTSDMIARLNTIHPAYHTEALLLMHAGFNVDHLPFDNGRKNTRKDRIPKRKPDPEVEEDYYDVSDLLNQIPIFDEPVEYEVRPAWAPDDLMSGLDDLAADVLAGMEEVPDEYYYSSSSGDDSFCFFAEEDEFEGGVT